MDLLRYAWIRLTAERGQTMAEYAMIVGVIALVVILAAVFLGSNLSSIFSRTARAV